MGKSKKKLKERFEEWATKWQVWLSFWALIISILGLGLSTWFSWDANQISKNANKLSLQANNTSNKAYKLSKEQYERDSALSCYDFLDTKIGDLSEMIGSLIVESSSCDKENISKCMSSLDLCNKILKGILTIDVRLEGKKITKVLLEIKDIVKQVKFEIEASEPSRKIFMTSADKLVEKLPLIHNKKNWKNSCTDGK